MNVILLYSVLATHVANFRVVSARIQIFILCQDHSMFKIM